MLISQLILRNGKSKRVDFDNVCVIALCLTQSGSNEKKPKKTEFCNVLHEVKLQ